MSGEEIDGIVYELRRYAERLATLADAIADEPEEGPPTAWLLAAFDACEESRVEALAAVGRLPQ